MLRLSFEVPLKHLNDFHEDQDFIFSLSMLYQSSKYTKYIKQCKEKGYEIWLDNSFNEKQRADSPEELIQIYKNYHPDQVVAPDSLQWPIEQLRTAFLEVRKSIPNDKLVLVISNFRRYLQLKHDLQPSHMAIPYGTRRSWYLKELETIRHEHPTHYLGMLSPFELCTQSPNPLSLDTSMPIKLAMVNMTIKDWVNQNCQHINTSALGLHGKSFFNAKLTTKQIDLAKKNIHTLRRFIS